MLYRPIPSIQRLQDLERSLYEGNILVEKQKEEIRASMNHVKLLEEEKTKMVSVTDDDLRRQQAFTLDIYNFHQCRHTALINLLIEANHARLVAETTAVPSYLNERHREQGTGFYTSKTPNDAKKPHKELVRKLPLNIAIRC